MTWGAIGAAAVGVVGGAVLSKDKGGGGGGSSTTTEIDPRMAKYIYGTDDGSSGGLLGDANAWYQGNKSGLNDQMRQGLNQQWQTYNDPSVMAGYRQQQNLGSGLLGAPMMGNPFSDGRASLLGGSMQSSERPQQPGGAVFGGTQTQQQFPSYQPSYGGPPPATANSGPFAAPPPPPPAAPAPPAAAPGQYPGLTYAPPEQSYMDASGNMYIVGADGRMRSAYPQDYGTGNGGA